MNDRQAHHRTDRLVRDHVRLAHRAAAQFAARVPNHVREDLLSAAMAGLADAARLFDEDRGVPFEAYALQRIRGALLDELRGLDWAGRALRDKGRRFERVAESLTAALGRTPTVDELAKAAGVSRSDLQKVTDDLHRVVVSLDNVAASDADLIARNSEDDPEERALRRERVTCLATAVRALPSRSQVVIRQYFLEGRPMADVARDLDVSLARVSQIRAEALELLRDGMNAQLDPDRVTPLPVTSRRVSRRAEYRATLAKVG